MKELRWLREEPKSSVLLFLFFLFHVLCIINYWEQRPRGALAMAKKKKKKKNPIPKLYLLPRQGKSHL